MPTMPERCPLCGNEMYGTGYNAVCAAAECHLPVRLWPAVQALKERAEAEIYRGHEIRTGYRDQCVEIASLKDRIASLEAELASAEDAYGCVLARSNERQQETERLKAELAAVKGFVSSLPQTANGFPIAIGLKVACPRGHIHEMRPSDSLGGGVYCCSGECWSEGCQGDSGGGTHYELIQCKAVHPLYTPDRKETE